MLNADVKSAVLLRVPSLTKVESRRFPLATFSKMALFDLQTTCYVSAACEKVGHIQMPMSLSL